MELDALLPSLKRRMVWDIVPDELIAEFSEALGIVGASADVNERERISAYERLGLLTPIGVPLQLFTELASDVIIRSVYRQAGVKPSDRDFAQLQLALSSGCHAVLAELLDNNILTYGPAVVMAEEAEQ